MHDLLITTTRPDLALTTKGLQKPLRSDTLFPGITRHARELNTNRSHLYLVLKGERPSPDLLRRYRALLKKEGRALPQDHAA